MAVCQSIHQKGQCFWLPPSNNDQKLAVTSGAGRKKITVARLAEVRSSSLYSKGCNDMIGGAADVQADIVVKSNAFLLEMPC